MRRLIRAGWSVLIAADLVALVLVLAAHRHVPGEETLVGLATVAIAAVSGTVGVAVVQRRPRNGVGRLLVLLAVAFGAKALLASYAVWSVKAHHTLPGAEFAGWAQGWVGLIAFPSGLTLLLLVFPRGELRGRGQRTVGVLAVVGGALVVAERVLEPVPVRAGLHLVLRRTNPTGVHGGWVDALAVGWPLSLLALVLGVVTVVRRAAREPADRRAVRLLASASVLLGIAAALTLVITLASDSVSDWVQVSFVLLVGVVIPVVVGIAALEVPSYGLERVLDRTLTWAGLSVLLVGGYVGAVLYLTALVGKGVDDVLRVVATAVVALAFQPVRVRLQALVARLVYGPDGDPRAAALALGRTSGTADADLDAVADALLRGLGATRVVVALDDVGTGTSGVERPTTTWPLVWAQEQVGRLEVDTVTADQLPGSRVRLRDEVADLLARAGHEARQRDRLATAQARRLAAAADERQRLRHDLHDGVGPAVSGLRMKVAAARRQLQTDTTRTDDLLEQTTKELEGLASEVRRVLDRMGPGLLGGAGLRAALASAADQLGLHADLDLDPALDELDPSVAEAVLRIGQEAMHNVAQHAGVDHCLIKGRLTTRGLELVVEDHGVGPEGDRVGVGTTSMRVRAADLGGTCTTTRGKEGGTVVRLRLPLPAKEVRGA